jgi:hypothetical protein
VKTFEFAAHINDLVFAKQAAQLLLQMIVRKTEKRAARPTQ